MRGNDGAIGLFGFNDVFSVRQGRANRDCVHSAVTCHPLENDTCRVEAIHLTYQQVHLLIGVAAAKRASSSMLDAPVLCMTRVRWLSTVLGLM